MINWKYYWNNYLETIVYFMNLLWLDPIITHYDIVGAEFLAGFPYF